MLHKNLIRPESIVIIGGSDNIHSPGGRVLKNLIDHKFSGDLFVVNPNKTLVQGIKSYQQLSNIPEVDLAIIAIAAKHIVETVKVLAQQKNTKGFIIFSAGFSEKDKAGAKLELEIVSIINKVGGSLLGPNNIGLINEYYTGVFTTPIPKLDKNGVDFISGSGATAVFIIEAAQSIGLTFSSIYTVGNSAQIGVEEVLEHFDQTFSEIESSKVKLLYIESIKNPSKFLKHTTSLIKKGCKIAAIKAGSSEAGNRAASSHTGAMASSDVFVESLFEKAGIIRCNGRYELINVAGILLQKESTGKNIGIITHAGGPAVMLTDTLSKNGLHIPSLKGEHCDNLLLELYEGSSISNPIDFLATGTAEQLETIIDYCEQKFNNIDSMSVIFGSPGLSQVFDVYDVLSKKIKSCKKPIYAILPSVVNVKNEIDDFIAKGNIAFTDEVLFGQALAKVYKVNKPDSNDYFIEPSTQKSIRKIIDVLPNGYVTSEQANDLLKNIGINFVTQHESKNITDLLLIANRLNYPVVLKVIGPLHKSDVGGVELNINNDKGLVNSFNKLMNIDGATSVLLQPMLKGTELFIGAKKESNYPHIIMCGLGGVFVEILKDVRVKMIPVSKGDAMEMITNLKSYPVLKGVRGQNGINIEEYAEIIKKISTLLQIAPEIAELDINPLLATGDKIIGVDVRIRIEK
ncbi:MAG: acetate--CoA ligase family protein [Aureibaculum sp.]|nr:acetate--CoA ligase family protein [Aureibaculum sp.]